MPGSDGRIDIDTKIDTGNIQHEMRQMQQEVKAMQNAFKTAEMKAMMPFRKELMQVQGKMLGLSHEMGRYKGTNDQFMASVQQLGKEQKKATDNMINNNKMLGMSMIQTAGTMLNMTTQAQRISDNFDRMANPMYKVNKAGLAVANSLNQMANRGNAAVLALKMLGPNAKMKDLLNMQMMINQGVMRFQSVALAAAVASGILYTALYKAASGPDPSEVYKKQADALAKYKDAVTARTKEIAEAWNIFENVQLKKTSGKQLMANLQEQVRVLGTWKTNLATIAQKAGSEFSNYLSQMGPQSAGEVAKIAAMSGPQLDKYVALWREKMKLAKDQAITELEGLRQKTQEKIKQLQDTLTPLGLATEKMKSALVSAFQPMVEVFGMVMTPIVNFIAKIGEMVTKFNEAHPTLAKMIQGFLMLIPILTLILAPLAVGIGLFGGLSAAFSAVWMIIGPLITGLAAMMGTVLLVSAAIVGLVVGLKYLWTTNEGFRAAVIAAWEGIKTAAITIWEGIKLVIATAIAGIKAYWDEHGAHIIATATTIWEMVKQNIEIAITAVKTIIETIMTTVKEFWEKHGQDILNNAKMIWEAIKSVVGTVMTAVRESIQKALDAIVPFIKSQLDKIKKFWDENGVQITAAVKTIWNVILTVIKVALDILMPLIQGALKIIEGIFKEVWPIISGIVTIAWNLIKAIIKTSIDVVMGIIKTVMSLIKGDWEGAWNAIKKTATDIWKNIEGFFKGVDLVQIGKDIIQGLIDGISSMASAVWDAVKNIADNIKKTISGAMEVKSPSRWMRDEIGKMIPAGIAVGIDANTSLVDKAMANVAAGIKSIAPSVATSGVSSLAGATAGPSMGDVYVTVPIDQIEQVRNVTDLFRTLRQASRQK